MTDRLPRGVRNNNPGNVRIGPSDWLGKVPVEQNTDGAFEQFTAPEYGLRCAGKLIQTYQRKYGIDTIRQIIERWAPPNENDTDEYIHFIELRTGFHRDYPLGRQLQNPAVLTEILAAIVAMECRHYRYPDAVMAKGVAMALS